jgi:hypothetical protein
MPMTAVNMRHLGRGHGNGEDAIARAVAELASGSSHGWEPQLSAPTYTPAAKPPLLVAPTTTVARRASQGSLRSALLAGAAVALVGGLLWAGVVIATRWDIGIVAWVVGAATGATVMRVFGGPVPGEARVAAGLMAAAAILVGKYVIFVHDLKKAVNGLFGASGLPAPSVHYLDTRQMGIFIHHFSSIVKPVYGLWLLCAFVAAMRVGHGKKPRTVRRRG